MTIKLISKNQKTAKNKATHLKEPMTHPRGERHLQGQTAILEKYRHSLVWQSLLGRRYEEPFCTKIRTNLIFLFWVLKQVLKFVTLMNTKQSTLSKVSIRNRNRSYNLLFLLVQSGFQLSVVKPKPKQSLWSITKDKQSGEPIKT